MLDRNISEITVTNVDERTKAFSGDFLASGGNFTCIQKGDGNNMTHEFIFTGNQYDTGGEPLSFTIVGEWEIAEVTSVLALMSKGHEGIN